MYFNQPGAKMCWELRSGSFNARFRNFVDSSPVPKVPTMVEIVRGSAVPAGKPLNDHCVIHRNKTIVELRGKIFVIILVRL